MASKVDARFISGAFLEKHADEVAGTMQSKLRQWGAHGWRIVGRDPELRIQVSVPRTVQRPRAPVGKVRVGGRTIKPSVVASQAHIRRARAANGTSPSAIGLVRAIAPGARVRVGRGSFQEFIGIAAILAFDGGNTLKLLTCGHAQAFNYSDEILPGDDPNGDALAHLDHNFMGDSPPLDAAVCTLTDAGRSVLASSLDAATWKFTKVVTPSAADNGRQSVFWQTHDGDDDAPTAPIESYSGTSVALFGPSGPQSGFVETSHGVIDGDSGSLLSLGNCLFALCSGYVGYTAFFTPISRVVERLTTQGTPCSIYVPQGS